MDGQGPAQKPLLVVSFFTAGTEYKGIAKNLKASLDKFRIPYAICGQIDQGSWELNTAHKAAFLWHCLDLNGKGWRLLWIDCDAVVQAPLDFFDSPAVAGADIAAHVRKGRELMSGTLYLEDSPVTRDVVQRWIELNIDFPRRLEQTNLHQAILEQPTVKFVELPPEYCFIFDTFRREHAHLKPVIEHFQASRRLRKRTTKGTKEEKREAVCS